MKIFASVLILMLKASLTFAADDPFVGTWTMNLGASKYPALELPRKMVIVMRETPEGVAYRSVSKHQDGHTTTAEYVADYSGHLALVVGNAGLMAPVSVRRIDSHTVEASYMRGFKAAAVSRRVVSENGLILTITTTSLGESGVQHSKIGVYDKAKSRTQDRP
jgi:hypothetical protein